ncbi:protein RGF1 INDUCIBLE TRANSCRIPTION FACTOR 1-like isoform X2 [Andrographis paniculata]|uniref:protein RGF1 INDUCIBLE TRANSCRIPTION FACTOR 1-like isoform X2 n=1 Tax=Andrographis paniculata TaxID=175694 RepID=UPI0021E75BD7|nr:protein RGF1 INDUCIBLE TRANSCRIPTION FACTOR 1-like isoform X2 [Andrographis paniculata]
MEAMVVPPWLERLLSTAFFNVCRTHGDAARSECNMFCLDCRADAFCFYCRSSRHKDHQVIQIRRSSYHDVVRVSEIQKVLDISGVQTYVINSARVLFLNERPQPKGSGKAVSRICEICGRSLLDTFRFCSLGCKVVGIKANGDASFRLDGGVKNESSEGGVSSRARMNMILQQHSSSRQDHHPYQDQELREGSQQDIYPPTPPPPPASAARRRKGVPQRAPFRS